MNNQLHSTAFVEEALARRYGSFGLERLGGREGVRKRVAASPRSVFAQLIALGEEIEAGDSGPRSSKA